MKNILVIGGAGFIGSHTVVELLASGYRPVIVDNFSNSERSVLQGLEELAGHTVTCYEQDFRQTADLEHIIKDEKIDAVIHFAAFKAVGESVAQPLKYYSNNVSGFVTLLEALLKQGIEHFVFSSSAAVYGNPPNEVVTEETVCHPESPYGWSKFMDETILRDTCAASSNLHGISLRYFNVVGGHESGLIGELPKGKPQNLLPIIVQATAGEIPPFTVFGTDYPTPDGTCLRDYIHVVDLAKAHVAALRKLEEESSEDYQVYNVGTGHPTSVLELIRSFETVNQVKVPYTLGDRRPGDPARCYASVEKIERDLGWKATQTIENAVRDAWRWQQARSSLGRAH